VHRAGPWLAALSLVVTLGCPEPSDSLTTREPVTGVETLPGVFQVTFNATLDQARGFTATGDTILFRSFRAPGGSPPWEILGIPAVGGFGTVEHAELYRAALRLPIGGFLSRSSDRVLTTWTPGNVGGFFGPAGCPNLNVTLTAWHFIMYDLPAEDGAALSGIPFTDVTTRTSSTLQDTPGLLEFRVRIAFGEADAQLGANPFGPALDPGATTGRYSDGDAVWHFDVAHPETAPDSVGPGIYPAISPDGALEPVAVPGGVDSTTKTENVSAGIRTCRQQEWFYTAQTWTSVVTNAATGDTVAKVDGTEPVFDPLNNRLFVRRPSGIFVVDLTTGAAKLYAGTAGAFSLAISPDGKYLAFSKQSKTNADVFYIQP
jgi:hypothetical protein